MVETLTCGTKAKDKGDARGVVFDMEGYLEQAKGELNEWRRTEEDEEIAQEVTPKARTLCFDDLVGEDGEVTARSGVSSEASVFKKRHETSLVEGDELMSQINSKLQKMQF